MKNYSRVMDNWMAIAPALWWGDPLDVRFFLADRLSELTDKKILDISCGYGIILAELNTSNYKVGLDISQDMLKFAKKINPDGNFVRGDAMQLPFRDISFDVIYAAHVIPGYDYAVKGSKEVKQAEWSNEIKRILIKNGILFLTTPNGNYPAYKNAKIKLEELKDLLSQNFDIEKLYGFNPFPIYPGIIAKIPGIWNFLAFLMKIQLYESVCKSFFVIAKPRK